MAGGKPPGVMEGGKQPGALGEGCPTPSPLVGEGRGEGGQSGFAVGDRVISNGKHAEMVSVPVNLCARIPDNVSDEHEVATMSGFAQRFLEKGREEGMQQGVQRGEARILTAQLRLRNGELPAALSQRI